MRWRLNPKREDLELQLVLNHRDEAPRRQDSRSLSKLPFFPLKLEDCDFVEEETMTRDEKGISYGGEEHIKIMEPIFKDMTKNIKKGFELFVLQ